MNYLLVVLAVWAVIVVLSLASAIADVWYDEIENGWESLDTKTTPIEGAEIHLTSPTFTCEEKP